VPIVVFTQTILSWVAANIGGLSYDLETTVLEFIMLGRIPGTELYFSFETIIVLLVSLMLIITFRVLFKNPNPYS